jgi:AraC-like DNA-binding protein
MSDEPIIDRDVVRPILDGVHELGGDVEVLLEESGLIKPWLDSAQDDLPEGPVWEFLERGAQTLDMHAIGLQAAATLRIGDLGAFGKKLEQSLILHRCLEEYICGVNCHSSHARFWLDETTEGVWFCRHGIDLIDVGREYVEQFTLQLMIRLVQLAAGPGWSPTRIRVQAKTTWAYREFGAFESTEIECVQPVTAVWVPRALGLEVVAREHDDPITHLVRESIVMEDGHVFPSLDTTAERHGFSIRTMQRELSKNGLDWSRLLDQVRLRVATKALASKDNDLIEIARDLGYTDPANFGRAFRRWTGLTPGTYRSLLHSADKI